MSTLSLLGGALTLRTQTLTSLRERSDVFQRGLMVILIVGWLAGAFAAGVPLITRSARATSEQQVINEAVQSFRRSYTGNPTLQPMIESYVTETAAMIYEVGQLPPNAGTAFRPVARLLNWFGALLATPFSFGFMGMLLLAGLLVHWITRWFGGHGSLAQMLGLTALGWAPHLFNPVSSLLMLGGDITGSGLFGLVNFFVGWIIFIWGAAVYVKATEVAEGISLGRAFGAVLTAIVIVLIVGLLLSCIAGGVLISILAPVFRSLGS